jgi:hypothetical protein
VKAASMYQTSSGGRARVSSSLDGNPGVIACGAKLREIKEDLRRRIHQLIPEQGRWLAQVIRGYFAYHAVPTNFSALSAIRYHVMRHWLWNAAAQAPDGWETGQILSGGASNLTGRSECGTRKPRNRAPA